MVKYSVTFFCTCIPYFKGSVIRDCNKLLIAIDSHSSDIILMSRKFLNMCKLLQLPQSNLKLIKLSPGGCHSPARIKDQNIPMIAFLLRNSPKLGHKPNLSYPVRIFPTPIPAAYIPCLDPKVITTRVEHALSIPGKTPYKRLMRLDLFPFLVMLVDYASVCSPEV